MGFWRRLDLRQISDIYETKHIFLTYIDPETVQLAKSRACTAPHGPGPSLK
jgi:hypothetical protein